MINTGGGDMVFVSGEIVWRNQVGMELRPIVVIDEPAFIIGHEAITIGIPTLNTPKISARLKATTRYFGLVIIWVL